MWKLQGVDFKCLLKRKMRKISFSFIPYITPNNQPAINGWAVASLVNVICHLENGMATGHYTGVTLFWLCHWLIYLSLVWSSHLIDMAGTILSSSSVNSSLWLCQGQLLGPQLLSSKMLLHESNTNKPSVERWQSSERRCTNSKVFSGTTHAAEWCLNDHSEKGLYIEITWHKTTMTLSSGPFLIVHLMPTNQKKKCF